MLVYLARLLRKSQEYRVIHSLQAVKLLEYSISLRSMVGPDDLSGFWQPWKSIILQWINMNLTQIGHTFTDSVVVPAKRERLFYLIAFFFVTPCSLQTKEVRRWLGIEYWRNKNQFIEKTGFFGHFYYSVCGFETFLRKLCFFVLLIYQSHFLKTISAYHIC